MRTYEVTGRPLRRNGRQLNVGTKLRLAKEDGEILAGRGRIREASSGTVQKAKPAKTTKRAAKKAAPKPATVDPAATGDAAAQAPVE